MQITLQAKGKPESKNYRPKKIYSFSQKQLEALEYDNFIDIDQAKAELGKQATMVMKSLVALELFKRKKDGSFEITKLGQEVAGLVSERV